MLSYGENASILLLSGNISYERVVEKISSLEPILAQENDYLRNQGKNKVYWKVFDQIDFLILEIIPNCLFFQFHLYGHFYGQLSFCKKKCKWPTNLKFILKYVNNQTIIFLKKI
jgi:hypothetical protein